MKINALLANFANNISEDNPRLAKQFEKTACRYAKPCGCCETLIYIIQKIKNALLSLIGCSDWQRTVRMMRKEIYDSPEINKLQEAKKFVKIMKLSKQNKTVAIDILDHQINGILKLLKPLPEIFIDLAVQVQNGKFIDKNTFKAKVDPIFEGLEKNEKASEQKVVEEFKTAGLYNVYEAISALSSYVLVKNASQTPKRESQRAREGSKTVF